MRGTISSAGKFRNKVQISERPGFNHFTKPGPGFSSKIPIFSKHRRTGAGAANTILIPHIHWPLIGKHQS